MNKLRNFSRSTIESYKRLPGILTNPRAYFSHNSMFLLDGVWVILLLFIATLAQKLLWIEPGKERLSVGWAVEQAFVNCLLVWSIFFTLIYAALIVMKRPVNLAVLAGQVGAAGLPLVIATLFSDLLWLLVLPLPVLSGSSAWVILHQILSWLGLILSWPGLFGYFLLYHGYNSKRLWAILLPGVAMLVISISNLLVLLQ